MIDALRRALVPITLAVALASIVSACSGSSNESGAVATSGQASALIGVQLAQGGFITVENRAGIPLVGMEVTAKPSGNLSPYSYSISRMETGGKVNLSVGDLREPRGGRINPNLVRVKELVVTASDVNGKKYEVSLPWSQ